MGMTPHPTATNNQGPRYNFLLEGAKGIPDDDRSELKPWRRSGGTPLEKFDARLLKLALKTTLIFVPRYRLILQVNLFLDVRVALA